MTLLRPALPVFDGLITIVRADDADAGVQALRSLEVGAPHVVVAWREGASVEPLAQAVTEIRDQLARLEDTTGTALAGVDVEQFRNELREVAGKLRTAVNRVDVDVGVDLEGSATWLDALGDFLAGKGRFAQARRRSEATSSREDEEDREQAVGSEATSSGEGEEKRKQAIGSEATSRGEGEEERKHGYFREGGAADGGGCF